MELISYTKYGKGKGKLLPKIEEISGGKAPMKTCLKYFDHRCLSQSEESKCTWTHSKDGAMWPPFPHGVNALLT